MMALQHAMCVVLFACLVVLGDGYDMRLRVAAFNIKSFGVRKMKNEPVVNVLKQILIRYDITLIQEIRNARAIHDLLKEVNSEGVGTWKMWLSDQHGRSKYYKEMYAYFYKTETVSYAKECDWEDTFNDFERPPYIVRFRARKISGQSSGVSKGKNRQLQTMVQREELIQEQEEDKQRKKQQKRDRPARYIRTRRAAQKKRNQPNQRNRYVGEFGFIGIHVKPTDAVHEISKLVDVYDAMVAKCGLEDFIIGGDFNAGGSYVRPRDWRNIKLRTDRFKWVITDNIGTTTSKNNNFPYDRLVLAGAKLRNSYVHGTANIFDFSSGIDHDLTKAVSDHYPVEMQLHID